MRVPDEVTLIQLFLYVLLDLIHLFHPHAAFSDNSADRN